MSAQDNLSPQFASVHDLVWKYAKTDVEDRPMTGLHPDAGPHARGRDWFDLVETKHDYAPEHSAAMEADVSRRGVREPIGIDRTTTPPTVSDGHTRLMAAYKSGQRRVPVKDQPIGTATDKHVKRS